MALKLPRRDARGRFRSDEWFDKAIYLDGPKLVAWLTEEGATRDRIEKEAGAGAVRAYQRWCDGTAARAYPRSKRELGVDEILLRLGLHLSYVPDNIWRDPPPRTMWSQEVRDKAIELYKRGLGPTAIARQLAPDGPGSDAINGWVDKVGVRGMYGAKKLFPTHWDGIDKKADDECWPWRGRMRVAKGRAPVPVWQGNGRPRDVHRLVYAETFRVELAKQHKVTRTCGNDRCCNPAHMELMKNAWMAAKRKEAEKYRPANYTIWGTKGR